MMKSFIEGYHARKEKLSITENPYKIGVKDWRVWRNGYYEGMRVENF